MPNASKLFSLENKKEEHSIVTSREEYNFLLANATLTLELDENMGYLYVKGKKDVPKMSPNGVIMILELGDGRYVYKTT